MSERINDTDILIVGGGMVGASLAAALIPLPYRVTVIETSPPRDPGQPSYDDRETALSWGSRRIIETLGLWDRLRPAATSIDDIHVSDRGQFGVTRLSKKEQDVPALGYVVEKHLIAIGLLSKVELDDEQKKLIEEKRAEFEASTKQQDAFSQSEYPEGAQLCSRCNTAAVVMMDGCMTCLSCGDSKCG